MQLDHASCMPAGLCILPCLLMLYRASCTEDVIIITLRLYFVLIRGTPLLHVQAFRPAIRFWRIHYLSYALTFVLYVRRNYRRPPLGYTGGPNVPLALVCTIYLLVLVIIIKRGDTDTQNKNKSKNTNKNKNTDTRRRPGTKKRNNEKEQKNNSDLDNFVSSRVFWVNSGFWGSFS